MNYGKSVLVVLYKWKNNIWMAAHLLATPFILNYFKSTVENYCSKISFKIMLLIDNASCPPATKSSDGAGQ